MQDSRETIDESTAPVTGFNNSQRGGVGALKRENIEERN